MNKAKGLRMQGTAGTDFEAILNKLLIFLINRTL